MEELLELAVEAKRQKDFDAANKYYQKIMKEHGATGGLFRSIAEVLFLEKRYRLSVLFNLAAVHLSVYEYLQLHERGDEQVESTLASIPDRIKKQFPHEIGSLILFQPDVLNDISHAVVEEEDDAGKKAWPRKYVEVYEAKLLDDGSYADKLKEHQLTEEEQLKFEQANYHPIAVSLIIDNLKWDDIENPNVHELYLK